MPELVNTGRRPWSLTAGGPIFHPGQPVEVDEEQADELVAASDGRLEFATGAESPGEFGRRSTRKSTPY